jgi:hypothetical protein
MFDFGCVNFFKKMEGFSGAQKCTWDSLQMIMCNAEKGKLKKKSSRHVTSDA